jgi:hypothetical protein
MAAQPPPVKAGVNCWQCRHFAVSWDPRLPYSCKLLGFKSLGMPSLNVMRLDGRACQGFAAKLAAPVGNTTIKR